MDARKEKSRAAIVAAFSELLCEEDYSKITVGDIIARAHVGRATFYGLFKSKDDLLAALVSDICTHALDDDGTPLDDPHVQVEHILNSLSERRPAASSPTAYARPSCHEQPKPSPSTPQAPPAPWTAASYYTT